MKLTILLISTFIAISNAAEWTISLEYSVNDFANVYPLGSIELRRNFDGNYTGTFKPVKDTGFGKKLLDFQDETYSVRAKSSSQAGETFLTSSSPCLFLQSNLFHLFWVSINPDKQTLSTITVFPDSVALKKDEDAAGKFNPNGKNCKERTAELSPSLEDRIGNGSPKGVVTVVGKNALPSPDTASFVQKLEREKRAKQQGGDADNRGFLAKYWMYILPVVVIAMISSAINPEAAEGAAAQ